MGKKIKSSSVRYKSIHIVSAVNGKKHVFSLNKVVRNSQTWWQEVQKEPDSGYNSIMRETVNQSDISDVTDVNDLPVVHEPVAKDTVEKVDGKAVSDPTSSEQGPENASKENFQDAVETPEEAASSTTTDEVQYLNSCG